MKIEDMKGALPHFKKTEKKEKPQQLMTIWGEHFDPERVREEYPRPQMVRDGYEILNGYWNYAITKEPRYPRELEGRILVPFSPEAYLSGVDRQLMPDEYLWYECRAKISRIQMQMLQNGGRLLLHFEAVDQCAHVWINGIRIIKHTGGYLPFTVDVTGFLDDDSDTFRITVCVQDYSDTSYHSRGKQKLHPGGMYYTAQSGIWQSVWTEAVPSLYIRDMQTETDPAKGSVQVTLRVCDMERYLNQAAVKGMPGVEKTAIDSDRGTPAVSYGMHRPKSADFTNKSINVRIYAPTKTYNADGGLSGDVIKEQCFTFDREEVDGSFCVSNPANEEWNTDAAGYPQLTVRFSVVVPQISLWDPDHPWLYPIEVCVGEDRVRSYFAMRSFSKKRDTDGHMRILLNGKGIFLNGVLDQGYWPDGLYTAPADEALIYDIAQMKALGFNMLRKHAKIEDRRWYYHCDRMGMIVWQDMVNGGGAYSAFLLTYLPTGVCVPGPLMKREKQEKRWVSAGRLSPAARLEYRITGRADERGRKEFRRECLETIDLLKGFGCIMTWVLFNEGWGQFDTEKLTDLIRDKDPGRFVDSASGWFEHKTGDFKSIHNYFRKMFVPADVRVNVLSEYGGAVYHVDGHSMYERTYGYHTCTSAEEFQRSFHELVQEQVLPLEKMGLCGAVYTQVSDIEEETNGLLTYDRKVCKVGTEHPWA